MLGRCPFITEEHLHFVSVDGHVGCSLVAVANAAVNVYVPVSCRRVLSSLESTRGRSAGLGPVFEDPGCLHSGCSVSHPPAVWERPASHILASTYCHLNEVTSLCGFDLHFPGGRATL